MKRVLIGLSLMLLSGCSWETLHTGYYQTDSNGDIYERHYLVIPYESKCSSMASCANIHRHESHYNMKTHKLEVQ